MKESFAISYVLLCGLLLLEAVALLRIVRKAAKLNRLYSQAAARRKSQDLWHLPKGMRTPDFSAPLLGTDQLLTRADLEGRETILLFISPADADSLDYQRLHPAFSSMWDTVAGEVYLVCSGTATACEHLVGRTSAKAILDEDGWITSEFHVLKTPKAVLLDEEARVIRIGEPESRPGIGHASARNMSTEPERNGGTFKPHPADDQFVGYGGRNGSRH